MKDTSYLGKIASSSSRLDRFVYIFNLMTHKGHEDDINVSGHSIHDQSFNTEHDLETYLASISHMDPITTASFWVFENTRILQHKLDFYGMLRAQGLVKYEAVYDSTFRKLPNSNMPVKVDIDTSPYYVNYGLHGYAFPHDTQPLREVFTSLFFCEKPFLHNHGYIILGCSGSGKSTLVNQLASYMKWNMRATKITTRSSRPVDNEANVRCVAQDKFMRMLHEKNIVGSYSAYGNFYGYLRDEIDMAMRSGLELFIDTTSLSAAVSLRESFPDYFRVVAIDSDEYTLEDHLSKRQKIISSQAALKIQKSIDEGRARLDHILDAVKLREMIVKEADLVLYESHFGVRQQRMRNYIIDQRFPSLIMPLSHSSSPNSDRS